MFFIDGGHDYSVALSDMQHCLALARPSDLIVLDDVCTVPRASWTFGPTRVWHEVLLAERIRMVGQKDFSIGHRGWGWGYPTSMGSKTHVQ